MRHFNLDCSSCTTQHPSRYCPFRISSLATSVANRSQGLCNDSTVIFNSTVQSFPVSLSISSDLATRNRLLHSQFKMNGQLSNLLAVRVRLEFQNKWVCSSVHSLGHAMHFFGKLPSLLLFSIQVSFVYSDMSSRIRIASLKFS